jgi:NhaA family Na+:H+ antiporter
MSKKATQDQLPAYALAGVALWYCLLRGGINADIAGVATAMALPAPPPSGNAQHEETLLDRLHHVLAPWTAFLIMPIFALANTAVPFASTSAAALLGAPVAQGIALGLVFGKPLGIVAFSMVRARICASCMVQSWSLFVRVLAAGSDRHCRMCLRLVSASAGPPGRRA